MTYDEVQALKTNQPYFLSNKEVQSLCGCSHMTVMRWRESGKLPFIMVNGHYKYPLDGILSQITVIDPKKKG